ncbi:MAG: flavin reductase family protein [Rubrimonas sp.]|uniref:flavin reductase family protein n=1 Tax=Rubrimonas sp. TaxID=2036015 RepID=UPI002FDDF4AF
MTSETDPDARRSALRRAFGAFPTGVTIVATLDAQGAPTGFTANSFTSVSLDPPLLLVCLAHSAATYAAFETAEHFAVSVLGATQREASRIFATRGADKFATVRWRAEATGAPVIEGAAAWFDCAMERRIKAGDHTILLGRIAAFGEASIEPLGYWRGAYVGFGPEGGATAPRGGGVRVSAIVERRRSALLRIGPDGAAALPSADAFGPAGAPGSLLGQLGAAGVWAELPFVFESCDAGHMHHVVYRGAAPDAPDPAPGWRFAPFDDLPLARMAPHEAATLRRYVDERAAHAYGRYVGDQGGWAG